MKTVGVEQLKARLSEYVRLVRAGETVLVTEHDEVVAELRPARRQIPSPTAWRSCWTPSRLRGKSLGPRSRTATGRAAADNGVRGRALPTGV
jgi:antitoxin (DNA-binding transcriptional repressor) of toxin-antitoxin stability system